jgi:hypothetical protein
MGFVVRITNGRSTFHSWLSPPNKRGFRTLATRDMADVFQSREDAHAAIGTMPRTFADAGWVFSVEPAH